MRHTLTAAVVLAAAGHAPAEVGLFPADFTLDGRRAGQQLLVDYGGRDATRSAAWSTSDPAVVKVSPGGYAAAVADGTARVTATVNGKTFSATVNVKNAGRPDAVSFADEIIPVLNRAGCNQGACHGTPHGKGGFKLSLRGYDIPYDFKVLTRGGFGRRVDAAAPDNSLILLKGLAAVPHQGGRRFEKDSQEYRLLRRWIAEGLNDDPAGLPVMRRLEITPGRHTIQLTGGGAADCQQVVVRAFYSDGSVRDVTRLCAYSTSNADYAEVGTYGLVKPLQRGEVAVIARYQHSIVAARFTFLKDRDGFKWPGLPRHNYIDEHIDAKLRLLQIPPSGVSADHVFVRRAYLDAVGTLPTADEVRDFLADTDPDKRRKLIDDLLGRPEYADFWAMKWSDVLRLNERFMDPVGMRLFHQWIRGWVAADKPMDDFVRTMLASRGATVSVAPVNFYRTMADATEMAETVSQLFMGVRMNCAKCHNHPFEKWTQDDYYGLAAVFANVKLRHKGGREKTGRPTVLKLGAGEVVHPRTGERMAPRLPGGGSIEPPAGGDYREAFGGWLTDPSNPFFAKTLANRVWFHLTGRGIVSPVDDFRESNPSCNDALLKALADDLITNGYRLKPLIRRVMNSRAYQASASPNRLNVDDAVYFSRALPRMLTAEQMLDAVCQVTGVPEKLPMNATRAVQIPGARVNIPFLKTFNRPARNLACECERERSANLAQALQLISGSLVQRKLDDPRCRVGEMIDAGFTDDQIVEEFYLATLSRRPSGRENQAIAAALAETGASRQAVLEDLVWSLLNSKEFQFQH